ncbi:MAG: FAD-dependent monooxygenase [Microbacterium sp.]|jgi:2-polyprenyl-6-methoxyphenol hydroxylase-like FAD-dependent oxidoreductase|nr:FAD-dependent monooxygenase [Microbacterium sp.]
MDAEEWDVAVVGAGPVGLLLAGELAGAGIRTVVLERAETRSGLAKANGVVGRSAVDLARLGVLDGTGLRVVSPPRFPFGPLSLDLGFGPRNPLHVLPIPQRGLEELLETRARARGAEVRRGNEVIALRQDAGCVEVDVRGRAATVAALFLVGCDGARSFVRKQAGIGFPGVTSDEIAWIARVTIPGDVIALRGDGFDIAEVGHVAAQRRIGFPGGAFTIAAAASFDASAPEDLYVISAHEPRSGAEPREDVSVAELRAALRRVLGAELPFTAACDVRSTVANSRQADAYRAGRVLLAGDAAHVFGAGGAALNAGIQDALDLAPRLRAVIRDGAAVETLDAYEEARRPAVDRTLAHTRTQAALGVDDESGRGLREVMGAMLETRGATRALGRMLEDG